MLTDEQRETDPRAKYYPLIDGALADLGVRRDDPSRGDLWQAGAVALCDAWERRDRVRYGFDQYAFRFIRRYLAQTMRRGGIQAVSLADDWDEQHPDDDGPSPPANLELGEQAERAIGLLAMLPPDERRAIELTILGGLTIEQAGREMGIRHQRVSELRAAGLRTMREIMEE